MAALAGGVAALILGIIGIIIWWGYFVKALMAGVPLLLILGGALAAYLGFEEIRDKKKAESFDETSAKKQDVDNLKEGTNEITGADEKPAE